MHIPPTSSTELDAVGAAAHPVGSTRADAPDPRSPGDAPTRSQRPGRRRLLRAADVVAGAVFAVAGAMFVAGATASQDGALRVDRTGGLRDAIQARAAANIQLQDEITVLAAQVLALQQQAESGPTVDRVTAQIAALAPMVGLTEVIGPGVTVTLDDAPVPEVIPEGLTGDDFIVHQEDVQGVVNALWRGGASGVTIMGERLISTSAVRCVGNTVILQGRVYSPPFVIAGVGDVAALEQALATEPAVQFFQEWATVVGLRYDQQVSDELVLPPYRGPLSPKFAQVAS